MKRKSLLLLISSSLAIGAMSIFSALMLKSQYFEVDSADKIYTMTLDKNNKIKDGDGNENDGMSGYVRTDLGSKVKINYAYFMPIYDENQFLTFLGNAWISFADPINGLKKMQYEFDTSGIVYIEAGYTPNHLIFKDQIVVDGYTTGTYDFDNLAKEYGVPPCYVKFSTTESDSAYIGVSKMKFFYTCSESPDPTKTQGTWTYEENDDYFDATTGNKSITLTGFTLNGGIPAAKTLVVPSIYDDRKVTRVKEGALDNVAWVETLMVPFVGGADYLDKEGVSYNFASIFGSNSAHEKYVPLQQYEGSTCHVWYIPQYLKRIIVTIGNFDVFDENSNHYIPAYAFYGLSYMIKRVDLGENIEVLNEYSFANSSHLQELVLPSSMVEAKANSFLGCSSLTIRALGNDIEINDSNNPNSRPYSVGYIKSVRADSLDYDICVDKSGEEYANLMGGNELSKIDIKKMVNLDGTNYKLKRIANRAFENNYNLLEVMIRDGSNLELVGHFAFLNCYKANIYCDYRPSARTDIFLDNWAKDAGAVFGNYQANGEIDGYHYYDLGSADVIYQIDGLDEPFNIDTLHSEFSETKVYFPAYGFANNLNVMTISTGTDIYYSNYAFYNCSNLDLVVYNGTMEEWKEHVRGGGIGVNVFAGTKVTGIQCIDGVSPILSITDIVD